MRTARPQGSLPTLSARRFRRVGASLRPRLSESGLTCVRCVLTDSRATVVRRSCSLLYLAAFKSIVALRACDLRQTVSRANASSVSLPRVRLRTCLLTLEFCPTGGHPQVPHACHESPFCPPWVHLAAKLCACGKRVIPNVRCSIDQRKVSCGSVCGK